MTLRFSNLKFWVQIRQVTNNLEETAEHAENPKANHWLLVFTSVTPKWTDLMSPDTPILTPLFLRNVGGLILRCIDTSDSESRRIFRIFEIYNICIPLHRSEIRNFVKISSTFCKNCWMFAEFQSECSIMVFHIDFHESSSEFHEIFTEIEEILKISDNFRNFMNFDGFLNEQKLEKKFKS